MRAYHAAVLAGVLLWQAAPVPRVVRDTAGRYHISTAAGTGRWEDASFDCNGNLIGAEPVPVTSYGLRADAMLAPSFRATVAVSNARGREGGVTTRKGTIGAVQLAVETRVIGFGSGITFNPVLDPTHASTPNLYLRLGNADRSHFRLDILEPTETPYLQPLVRMGVGFHTGQERRVGGFVGLGFGPYTHVLGQGVLTGDLDIPVGKVDLLLRGQVGPGAKLSQWGLGTGLRINLP